jgi:hypothetical protein
LQIYFDCYDEVSATTPLDPYSFRTKQVPFILSSVANVTQPASSSDVNDPHTSSLNQYLTLKILPGNDENVL